MAGPQLRFAALLLVLVAVVCSCSVNSVAAEAPLAPDSRMLRHQVHQLAESITTDASHSSSTSASSSGSGSMYASATVDSATSTAESTEKTHHEGPTTMSFVGPAVAGVLAIVLIGAVVTFKNRMGK